MSSSERPLPTNRAQLGRLGFESGSDIYERSRPEYPHQAVLHIEETTGISEGCRVLDLASGTGKLTRQLRGRGAECIAVEPSASMREVFQRAVPGVAQAGGTAEMIPVADRTVDVVVVAQAFHWFDPLNALPEIVRVLRPRGWLALIWNERDESDPVMAELVRISKWDRCQPYPVGMDFGSVIDRSNLFGPVDHTKYHFVQELDQTSFVEQVASRSYVQVLPDDERRALLSQVADFGTSLGKPIAVPYVTDLFCAQVAA